MTKKISLSLYDLGLFHKRKDNIMDKEKIRRIAENNCDGKLYLGKERHVEVAVREYEMLHHIGAIEYEEIAAFFRVPEDDITRTAWADFIRGMTNEFNRCIDLKQEL